MDTSRRYEAVTLSPDKRKGMDFCPGRSFVDLGAFVIRHPSGKISDRRSVHLVDLFLFSEGEFEKGKLH